MTVFHKGAWDKIVNGNDAIEGAKNIQIRSAPTKPNDEFYLGKIDAKFYRMGEMVGICPFELKAILEAEYSEDQELIISTIKKLITVVKISDGAELHVVRQRQRVKQNKLDKAKTDYERIQTQREEDIVQKEATIVRTLSSFAVTWHGIVDSLAAVINKSNKTADLMETDLWFAHALAEHRGCLKINKAKIEINVDKCKALSSEVVVKLRVRSYDLQKDSARRDIAIKISKMSIRQLYMANITHHLVSDDEIQGMLEKRRRVLVAEQEMKENGNNVYSSYSSKFRADRFRKITYELNDLINEEGRWKDH